MATTPSRRQTGSSRCRLGHVFLAGILLMAVAMLIVLQGAHRQLVLPDENLKKVRLENFKKKHAFESRDDPVMKGRPSTTVTSNIWQESSSTLPQWLKEYFAWHKQERQKLIKEWKPLFQRIDNSTEASRYLWNQTDYRFLVIRCFAFDRKCGGLADRLLPLPYLLHVAHNTSRLLLIHFQKPAPLEAYLTPPRGGIDWRIPDWLLPAMPFGPDSRRFKAVGNLEWHAHNFNDTVVQSIFQAWHYGAIPYEERKAEHEPLFREVIRDTWRVLFTPVPPLQQIIRQELQFLNLQEGRYASVHIRLLYAIQEHQRKAAETQAWTRNAIHCASQLYPGGPFYLASDSPQAVQVAVEYGQQLVDSGYSTRSLVHTRNMSAQAPHHFDRIPTHPEDGKKAAEYQASDYYETYVDLMLLAMGQCVTYGVGGYGKLASWLSYNQSCSSHHFKKKMNKCDFVAADPASQEGPRTTKLPSLLAPPMDLG